MPISRSVSTRNQKLGIEELGVRCDSTEFPEFWQVAKADSYWAATEAAYLGPGSASGAPTTGTAAFAVLGSRVAVIVAPHGPAAPATWLTFDRPEATAVGVGQTGFIAKRPVSIELEVGGASLFLKQLSKVYRSSGSQKGNQEAAFSSSSLGSLGGVSELERLRTGSERPPTRTQRRRSAGCCGGVATASTRGRPTSRSASRRLRSVWSSTSGSSLNSSCRGSPRRPRQELSACSNAVDAPPPTPPSAPCGSRTSGSRWRPRRSAAATGHSGDAAVRYLRAACAGGPTMPCSRCSSTTSATSCTPRFDQVGSSIDLSEAVDALTDAVSATSPSHPDLPLYLGILEGARFTRFQHGDDPADLDAAVDDGRRPLDLTPVGHRRDRSGRPTNLGPACISAPGKPIISSSPTTVPAYVAATPNPRSRRAGADPSTADPSSPWVGERGDPYSP